MIEPQPGISQPGEARPLSRAGLRLDWRARQLLSMWLAMRVLLSGWVVFAASFRPTTLREKQIAIWPPSAPLGAWLERILLAPWERQDVEWYIKIAGRGYRADDGTAQFHPLLAWLATPLARLTGQPLLALLLVSSLASLLLLFAFERLARLDLPAATARTSTLLFVFAPLGFVLFAPYSESLFLLWGVLCLWYARQGAWWRAGLCGGLAVLTRQQGVLFVLPLAWELWEAAGRDPRRALRAWRDWLALALVPLGLLTWMLYRAVALNDLQAKLGDMQALIYSLLISPSANKVVPVQAFLWPWDALGRALEIYWQMPTYYRLIDLVLGAGFIALTAAAWRGMRVSYRIYTVAIILISFAYYTGRHYPYMGLPRHLLLAFPVFIGLGPVFRDRTPRMLMVAGGFLAMLFLLLLYTLTAWIV